MSMKPSPELQPVRWDALVVLAVALLAVLCGVTVWGQSDSEERLTVAVSIDGMEVERCLLTEFSDEERVYSSRGYTLSVSLTEDLGVKVAYSDCPTQDCVHTGTISRGGQSIVCLPARVIIRLEGGQTSDGPDLIVG